MLNSNLIKKNLLFLFLDFFSRSTYSHLAEQQCFTEHSLGNAALRVRNQKSPVDTRYTLERTGCRANCRYKHPGKQFQTRLYQRVISRAGNNWRGCRFEDLWKGNKSNDSDKRERHETETLNHWVSKLECQHLHIWAVNWRVIIMGQNKYNAELVRPRQPNSI